MRLSSVPVLLLTSLVVLPILNGYVDSLKSDLPNMPLFAEKQFLPKILEACEQFKQLRGKLRITSGNMCRRALPLT